MHLRAVIIGNIHSSGNETLLQKAGQTARHTIKLVSQV